MTKQILPGHQVGPYIIETVIGQGTTATVYRAVTPTNEPVALKLLTPALSDQTEVLARFEREGQTAARLHHPHIVPVLDVCHTAEGLAYLVMPLVEGQTLEARLEQTPCLDELTATEIGWQIADALHFAHSQNIIHRDVKPSNILLTADGHALLTDFGIAHALDCPSLTQAGHLVGTPAYLSPEQALHRKDVDSRADLYSLGVVLYRMVTGRLPFEGSTFQLLHGHIYEPPPLPSTLANLTADFEAVILQALEKQPDRRFADGRVMARELLRLNDWAKRQPAWQGMLRRQRFRLKNWLWRRLHPRLGSFILNTRIW